jgi:riboflavin synthase
MFTGIVSGLGQIVEAQPAAHGMRLLVQAPAGYLDDVDEGDSIALNGACMTVTAFDKGPVARFRLDISAESLTRPAGLDATGPVNL